MRQQVVKTQSNDKKKSPPEYDNFAVEMNHKKYGLHINRNY